MIASSPLVIACVKWGERYGAYYVNMLSEMVRRHLPQDCFYSFQCFTDDPEGLDANVIARELPEGLTGWWNKLYLFKKGVFADGARIIYFDLDTLITGPLEGIANYKGNFAILRDFYRPDGYCSAVMLWPGDKHSQIWERFEAAGRPDMAGGDQAWVEQFHPGAALLQDIFPGAFASYKVDCHPLPPPGASVVCFHGEPKQDNCDALWVRDIWKNKVIEHPSSYITLEEERQAHMRLAQAVPAKWLAPAPAHGRRALIIGGGPTLEECLPELRTQRAEADCDVFAVGNVSPWLAQHDIAFDAHVLCHAESEQADWVPHNIVPRYYASTCHPDVLAVSQKLTLWDPYAEPMKKLSTTGLKTIRLVHALGYRNFHLYGLDSCCLQGRQHVYISPESERDRIFTVLLYGRQFQATQEMLRQADDFIKLTDILLPEGCAITIHGDGMLHFLATQAQKRGHPPSST